MTDTEIQLYRCDQGHVGRQKLRLVRVTEHDGQGILVEKIVALCSDHYTELRNSAEPRHQTEDGPRHPPDPGRTERA